MTARTEEEISLSASVRLIRHGRRDGETSLAHWWLVQDGVTVAFLSSLRRDSDGVWALRLCDIEVRPECRRQGLARLIVAAVEDHEGALMWTSGTFTPEGTLGLGWLRVLPGQTAGTQVNSMTFVRDWDTRHAEFRL